MLFSKSSSGTLVAAPEATSQNQGDSSEKDGPDDTVEGGIKAWCAVAGGWLAMMSTFGYTNAFGVYQDFYTRSHVASASRTSWIGSTQLFLLTATGLFAGKLVDLGYFRQTVLAGSFIYVFSLFMLSIAHPDEYYQIFLSQGIGMGLGAGLIYIPCLAIQSHHWRTHRAMAMGIVFTGSSVGGIVFPIMLNQLLNVDNVGFAWSTRATALIVLGLLALANCLMSDRVASKAASGHDHPKLDIGSFLTDGPYMLLTLGAFICLWGVFYPLFYVQLFAITHGVDPKIAFYTLAILNASSIPGRVLPNLFVHRYGTYNILLACGLCCGAITFALFGITTVAGIVVFAILSGFFSGGFLSVITAAIASHARHEGEIGLRMGFAFALAAVGSLTGTPIDGALLGDAFTWSRTIIFSGVTVLAGTAVLAVSRQMLVRRKGTQII
ncbi:MFS monocarboxylate transporter [Heterobasidion irregulare TC 32-1]|uniref:MFS monocarboxylate transporter n=1 Tax=Heterobasidion irregulare (strain TC 32-1) TaxID=747525 RepID=W4JTW9_HETIT|nr:MFS monocarboxylate transporter [Heterobasidion irregulare TC 32-1]ETW76306.1 MFS monocarboxylate transporter [Heterobasidion irregulare TC 32-1]